MIVTLDQVVILQPAASVEQTVDVRPLSVETTQPSETLSRWLAAGMLTPQRRAHQGRNKALTDEFADRVMCYLEVNDRSAPVGKKRPWLRMNDDASSGSEVAHV